MNRTLLQAQLMYNDMGKSEKKVADWLFSHSGEILPYSITDLASKCDSSEATIVRFSKQSSAPVIVGIITFFSCSWARISFSS